MWSFLCEGSKRMTAKRTLFQDLGSSIPHTLPKVFPSVREPAQRLLPPWPLRGLALYFHLVTAQGVY